MADTITISRHLKTPEIRSYMTLAAVKDVSNPETPPPDGIDEDGRSAQTFVVEVVAKRAGIVRSAAASGRDILCGQFPADRGSSNAGSQRIGQAGPES
jgi:hypothetical protein